MMDLLDELTLFYINTYQTYFIYNTNKGLIDKKQQIIFMNINLYSYFNKGVYNCKCVMAYIITECDRACKHAESHGLISQWTVLRITHANCNLHACFDINLDKSVYATWEVRCLKINVNEILIQSNLVLV